MKPFVYLLKNDLPRISNNIEKHNIRHLVSTQLKYDILPPPKKQQTKQKQQEKHKNKIFHIMLERH